MSKKGIFDISGPQKGKRVFFSLPPRLFFWWYPGNRIQHHDLERQKHSHPAFQSPPLLDSRHKDTAEYKLILFFKRQKYPSKFQKLQIT